MRPCWWPVCVDEALALPDEQWETFCGLTHAMSPVEYHVYHQAHYRRGNPLQPYVGVVTMGFHSGNGNAGDA